MRSHLFFLSFVTTGILALTGCRTNQPLPPDIRAHRGEPFGSLEVKDPVFFALVSAATPLEKLASGDVIKVSEVVRDLWRRDKERGLSAGEKRMLSKARQILVSELALAEGTNEDKAEAILDEVLAS